MNGKQGGRIKQGIEKQTNGNEERKNRMDT